MNCINKIAYAFLFLLIGVKITSGVVISYPLPSCYVTSSAFKLTADTSAVPVIEYTPVYDYADFSFAGKVTLEVNVNEPVTSCSISPLASQITSTTEGNSVTLTIDKPCYLIVKINKLKTLVISANALETDAPKAGGANTYNVTAAPFSADSTGATLVTKPLQDAIDAASKSSGTVYVPAGVYQSGSLLLKSNVSMYLEGGAVIQATGDATQYEVKFHKNSLKKDGTWFISTEPNSSNIKIYGRGTIDGNGRYLREKMKLLDDLIVPLQCSGFTLDGVICRDSGMWGTIPTRSNHITIQNTKHYNENDREFEDDAMDIQECQHVKIEHVILISEDDSFSTKTWAKDTDLSRNWPGDPQVVDDVSLNDAVAWSRCATFKVGFGCFQAQSNISVTNSISYRSMRALGVELGYGTPGASNIRFENIDVEGFSPRKGNVPLWLGIYTSKGAGPISNVQFKDINLRDLGFGKSTINGYAADQMVSGVKFINVHVPGRSESATSLDEMKIKANAFAEKIEVSSQ